MYANDSGVDTSNDSSCTNDNNNSSNANNSNSDGGGSKSTSFTIEFTKTLDRIAQKLSSFDSPPAVGNCSSSSRGTTRKILNRIPRSASCGNKPPQNPLAPYVKELKERKLRKASCVSNIELLISLLESGVNPNAVDEHQRSPLHLAASRGYKDVVKLLLTKGANPNIQDTLGNTPLHLAVCSASSYNFNMVVRILLQNGARVNICDRGRKTPLDLAKSKLTMMRTRRKMLIDSHVGGTETNPEASKAFVEMSMLTSLLQKTLTYQLKNNKEFDDLEARLRNLSTKEIEEEADKLLNDVACLKIE